MTSSNGNIFRVTGHLCGEFTAQRPVTRSLGVFFDLRSNKRLSKQWRGWWFETQSCPLWRHRNAYRRIEGDMIEVFKIVNRKYDKKRLSIHWIMEGHGAKIGTQGKYKQNLHPESQIRHQEIFIYTKDCSNVEQYPRRNNKCPKHK